MASSTKTTTTTSSSTPSVTVTIHKGTEVYKEASRKTKTGKKFTKATTGVVSKVSSTYGTAKITSPSTGWILQSEYTVKSSSNDNTVNKTAYATINRQVQTSSSKSVTTYSSPSTVASVAGFMSTNTTYTATRYQNGYFYLEELGSWVNAAYVTTTKVNDESTITISEPTAATINGTTATKSITDEQQSQIYSAYVNSEYGESTSSSDTASDLLVTNLNGVYGIPYQFPDSVDTKIPGTQFGGVYADRIISRMPLLIMNPGKVVFMKDYDAGSQTAIVDALAGNGTSLGEFLSDQDKIGKYYTFEYDFENYWKYVNTMNQTCATYLGIGDVTVDINGTSGKLSSFKWENACNSKFDSLLLSSENYVCFYCDADTTKNESFSNSTTQSKLASTANSYSDVAQELNFLVGSQTGNGISWMDEGELNSALSTLVSTTSEILGDNTLMSNIKKEFAVVATGGKLIFPEIWSDSEFSQSFDINIKLRCPNPNKVNLFLDIICPLNHLIAFTLPRTPTNNSALIELLGGTPAANSYMTPFLVRANYKGAMNCDMGIVTGLEFSKGKEGSWTVDGLPTEVDVSLTIKDLYNVMAMTTMDQTTEFLNNTTFINYLANNCGISINQPDLSRTAELYAMIVTNVWTNRLTGYNFWQKTKQGIGNKLYSMLAGKY
jgi:hypothetical protein